MIIGAFVLLSKERWLFTPRSVVIALLVAAIGFVIGVSLDMPRAQEPRKNDNRGIARPQLVGVSSCSASACHGGVETGKPLSEATTWRALDPHARSYETLLNEESQQIASLLWGDRQRAHDAPLCLKCHVHPQYDLATSSFRKQDGVGCEGCHGPAHEWRASHYRAGTNRLGLADTKSLAGRAAVCAACHVGTANANVDHDLIAAGHPALRFEFATYLANLPPHWDVAKDRRDKPDFHVQAWSIGQLVASACALELLAHRVNGKVWPEFAEFECTACHHNLDAKRPRRDGRPGSLVRAEWYTAMPELLLDVKFKRPTERQALAKHALDESRRMRLVAGKLRDIDRDFATMKRLMGDDVEDWDRATQRYLGLLSLRDSVSDKGMKLDDLDVTIANLGRALTHK